MTLRKYQERDAKLRTEKALPDDAGTATTDSLDLRTGGRPNTHFHQDCEFEISAPALATAELPDTKTSVYDLICSDNADLSSPTVVHAAIITQTGTGGAGADAEVAYATPPSDAKRYWGLKVTTDGSADASAKTMSLDLLF